MAKKHYFTVGETVWLQAQGERGVIVKLYKGDDKKTKAKVYLESGEYVDVNVNKLSFTVDKEYPDGTIGFARFRDTAIIPTKASPDDAGYDVFLDFPKDHKHKLADGTEVDSWNGTELSVRLLKLTPNLLPTGVGVKVPKDKFTHWANERGSTGMDGLLLLSGIVDSGYRDETFINIVPLFKDVVITNSVDKVTYTDDCIMYPYHKAVAQMIPKDNKQLRDYEIPVDIFKGEKTSRGANKLGSTDKK